MADNRDSRRDDARGNDVTAAQTAGTSVTRNPAAVAMMTAASLSERCGSCLAPAIVATSGR